MNKINLVITSVFLIAMSGLSYTLGAKVSHREAYEVGYMAGLKNLDSLDHENYHYELHAQQLTYNDIPVYFVDELPGIGGTKDKPDTCLAYYDTVKKAVWYSYLHDNVNPKTK